MGISKKDVYLQDGLQNLTDLKVLQENRRMKSEEIVIPTNISKTSIFRIPHNNLQLRHVHSKRVQINTNIQM